LAHGPAIVGGKVLCGLATWLPGHIAGSTIHHVRQATAAIVVAVLCAVGVWFMTARQRSTSVRS
jgi:hypothetical protein